MSLEDRHVPEFVDLTHATEADKFPNLKDVPIRLLFPARLPVSAVNYPQVIQAIRFMPYVNQHMNPLMAGMPGTNTQVINECKVSSATDYHSIDEMTGVFASRSPAPEREATREVAGIDDE